MLINSFYNEEGTELQEIPIGSQIYLFTSNESFESESIIFVKQPPSAPYPTGLVLVLGQFDGTIPAGAGLLLRFTNNGIIRWTLPQ